MVIRSQRQHKKNGTPSSQIGPKVPSALRVNLQSFVNFQQKFVVVRCSFVVVSIVYYNDEKPKPQAKAGHAKCRIECLFFLTKIQISNKLLVGDTKRITLEITLLSLGIVCFIDKELTKIAANYNITIKLSPFYKIKENPILIKSLLSNKYWPIIRVPTATRKQLRIRLYSRPNMPSNGIQICYVF